MFDELYVSYLKKIKKKSLNIDFTYRCPLQCPMCMRQKLGGEEKIKLSQDMPFSDFKKLLKFFSVMYLCGQISDPIYHPKFLEFLKYKKENYPNTNLSIHTTASAKSLKWWEKAFDLSDEKICWEFGLDGTTPEISKIYRVNTNHDRVMDVMKMGAARKLKIRWFFIVFEHNQHQIDEATKIAKDLDIVLKVCLSSRWSLNDDKIKPPADHLKSSNNDNIFKYYYQNESDLFS